MSSKNPAVRVRFAPSPTGYLHVGSIRSGLFNWLWARHNGGTFVLRVEDTDRTRLVDDALEQILATHDALGITPDEGPVQGGDYGPYLQSERLDIYKSHAQKLVETGALYRCWCSPERLAALRTESQKIGKPFTYDRFCLVPENQKSVEEAHVLRFRIPETPESVSWVDAVRGKLEFKTVDLDDFVALKADGYPTYHFANVVDDHLMKISHVLRADEWIPSTPKHLLLFAAFNWEEPIYAHLPPVQAPDGKRKLSKRDGAQSVQEYIDEGYLPEALRSFLASLGWNDGTTQEVYSTNELIDKFTLDRIQKSPAKFDKDHLTWVNGFVIRQMDAKELLERSIQFWPAGTSKHDEHYLLQIIKLIQERLKYLSELPTLTSFFFSDPTTEDVSDQIKRMSPSFKNPDEVAFALEQSIEQLQALENFSAETIQNVLTQIEETMTAEANKSIDPPRKNSRKQLFGLIRGIVTGQDSSPQLFPMLEVLGKEVTLRRLTRAQKTRTYRHVG